jgi:CRP/FNR family cyclic AMP-dependent transcriptional regulator
MADDIRDVVLEFFNQYPLRKYPKGQILIHAGDTPESIYYLVRGTVRQYDISYRGDEVVVNMFKSGAFFPMSIALAELPNKFFFDADKDIEVRVAPATEVVDFLRNHPDVTLNLLTRVYKGMDGLLGRVVQLMAGSARDRLVYELVIESKRFGTLNPDGSYQLSISESDLAARAGLSRETVSREISKFTSSGQITVSHSGIVVKDLSILEQMLE